MRRTPSIHSPMTTISTPPRRAIHTRYSRSSCPKAVAPAPSATKMNEKPATNSVACTSAVRRARVASSSPIPVMNVM